MSSTSEVLSNSTIDQAKKAAAGHDLKWLASQTLFSILDHLNKWIRKKYLSITALIRRMDDPEAMTAKDKVQKHHWQLFLDVEVDFCSQLDNITFCMDVLDASQLIILMLTLIDQNDLNYFEYLN